LEERTTLPVHHAYVSTHQRIPAYVSIRQHTSAALEERTTLPVHRQRQRVRQIHILEWGHIHIPVWGHIHIIVWRHIQSSMRTRVESNEDTYTLV
jgi:hypothetical protein